MQWDPVMTGICKLPEEYKYPSALFYHTGAGVNVIRSLDIDKEGADCMKSNSRYFSHTILNVDIRDKTVLDQPVSDIIVGTYPCTKDSSIADIHGARTGDDLFVPFFR